MIKVIFQKDKIGLGKRKQAVANIFLCSGGGNLIINKISGEKYFQSDSTYLNIIFAPLKILNIKNHIDIVVLVKGGGLMGQAYAIQLGIARQLCKMNIQTRTILRPLGFLKRDSRIKERKKYGLKKARKAPQYSKR